MSQITLQSTSVDQTRALGRLLADQLQGGDVIALDGPLGSGKTHFAQGLARGLGVPEEEPVVSPTFVLQRVYEGRLALYHLDAYRLAGVDELLDLGVETHLETNASVVAIEWAERVAAWLPEHTWHLLFKHAGDTERAITLRTVDSPRATALINAWQAVLATG